MALNSYTTSWADTPQARPLSFLTRFFYVVKPIVPRPLQLLLRRQMIAIKRRLYRRTWPINEAAGYMHDDWPGWPENKKFAFVIMHDVDTQKGHDKCRQLMDVEESLGFRSTFNIVPERYNLSKALIAEIKQRGFHVGVHGLKHDGKLFFSRPIFLKRARKINQYAREWGTRGFSTPSMLRNLEWMLDLDIDHSTSTFDTDPFEPQPHSVATIFPYWVANARGHGRFLEMPYTLPQDFTLFILMREKNNRIWREKLDWIAEKKGMALFNSHPDYMYFGSGQKSVEEYDIKLYVDFLKYVRDKYGPDCWETYPKQVFEYLLPTYQTKST